MNRLKRVLWASGIVFASFGATGERLGAAQPAPATARAPAGSDDIVLLVNGGRLRGAVMEQDPVKGVRIQLLDGTVRVVSPAQLKEVRYAGIRPINTAPPPPPSVPVAPPPPSVPVAPPPPSVPVAPPQPVPVGTPYAVDTSAGAVPPGAPPPVGAPSYVPTPPPADTPTIAEARRWKFSAGRYVLESLGAGLLGSLASYGTYQAACGGNPCIGGAIGGLLVDIGVTPLATYGIGTAMGGHGTVGSTYLLGLAAFAGGAAATTPDQSLLALAIGMVLEPFCAALGYELSSNVAARSVLGPNGFLRPTLQANPDPRRPQTIGLSGAF